MQDRAEATSRALLSIGINEYHYATPLQFCVSDATAVAETLSMQEFGFDEQIRLLNDQASRPETENAIVNLMRSSAAFKVLYFAGHGSASHDDGFLVTPDGDLDNPGVSLEWLRRQILGASGIVTVILDCCRAGIASIRDGALRSLRIPDIDRLIPSLSPSRYLLAATTSDGAAEESQDLGQGIFTFHVLEGLLGEAVNREGVITPLGLFDYVVGKFEESNWQKPIFKGEQVGKVVLGSGFATEYVQTADDSPNVLLDKLDDEARKHLDDYIRQMAIPLDEWHSQGYKAASQLLSPILRWFDRTAREYPEVASRDTSRERETKLRRG